MKIQLTLKVPFFHNLQFKTNSTNSISVIPYSYIPYQCIDGGSANPKVLRSSLFIIPQDQQTLVNIGIPLGLVLRPFVNVQQNNHIYDQKDIQSMKCRCGGYYNPNSYISQKKLYCNFCKIKGIQTTQINKQICSRGMYDILKKQQINICYYIVILELTQFTLKQKIIETTLLALKSGIPYINDNIRLCVIDYTPLSLTAYTMTQTQELQIMNFTYDILEQQLPILISKISINKSHMENYINQILNNLNQKNLSKTKNNQDNFLGDILSQMIQTQEQIFKKIIIISSNQNHKGNYDIGNRGQIYNKLIDCKQASEMEKLKNKLYFKSDQKFEKLNNLLMKYNKSTLDLFLFPQKFADIQNLKYPIIKNGGSLYLYQNYNTQSQAQFYYQFLRLFSRKTVFDISLSYYIADPLQVNQIIIGNSIKQQNEKKIRFNSFTQDQVLIINLSTLKQCFVGNKSSIQFKIEYKTERGTFEKIINFAFFKSSISKAQDIVAGFDPEATAKILITNIIIDRHKIKVKKDIKKIIIAKILQFKTFLLLIKNKLKQQHKKLEGRYLQSYQLFLTHMFYIIYRFPCYKYKSIITHIYQQHLFLSLPIEQTSKLIYPRIYQIQDKVLKGKSRKDQIYYTIPSNPEYLQSKGIYIIDKGKKIFLLLLNLQSNLIKELFGSTIVQQIQNMTSLVIHSKKSQILSDIIENIRCENFSSCEPLEIIMSQNKLRQYHTQLFIQQPRLITLQDDYQKFIKQYLKDI